MPRPPIPHRDELRPTATMAFGRLLVGLLARTGDPGARLITYRPLPDPYPTYERLRAHGPLYRSRLGAWFTVSHAAMTPVLRDGGDWNVVTVEEVGGVSLGEDTPHPVDHSLLVMNPPVHTALRRVAAPWFTPRAVRRWEELIQRSVTGFLDQLADQRQFDLVTEFATAVPVRVICELLGADESRRADFVRWGAALGGTLDGVQSLTEWRALRSVVTEMNAYFAELLARRRADPGDDVVSGLIAHDDEFSARDLTAMAELLLVAGFETTRNLIGNGVLAFLTHPDQARALRDDPDLATNAVEEILRYDSPVQYTMRSAVHDLELAGRPLRRGSMVVTFLGGANRDPAVFAEPSRFDITRPNAREHLSFSAGAHYCLGAGLARLEGEIALRELLVRFPKLQAAAPARRRPSRLLRGLESMPIDTGARASTFA